MYPTQQNRSLRLAILAAGLGTSLSNGAILVSLDPSTALYDSNIKGIVNDGGTAGSQSGIPVLGDTEHVKGLTFNIAFTPTAADLDRAVPADARTVLLIEIGGTSNGFGLYLIDGVPTVLSKQGSNDATLPASLNDTSLNAIAVQSPIGKLNAGTAYTFSASWNHLGTLELKVQPDGGSAVVSSHAISGTPGNWSGNDTLSVKTISAANAGGLAGNNAGNVFGPPFDVNNAFSFAGSVSRALFWNASSVTPPVATAPVVLGFEATSLPSTGKVRLHWRVTEGGAPAATNLVIKSGETIIHTPSTLENFADVNASGATNFTISATNATGTTTKNSSVAADTAFSAEVRADSPVAWFRFNDQAGSSLIADSAENAAPHDGRIFGQPVSGSSGFVDGAALFDGGSGIISNTILDPANLTSGFTVEAVIRRAPGVIGANPVVLAQRGTTGRFHLTSSADGKLLTDIGGGEVKHSDGKLHDNQWAHVAVVVDRLHTEVRWYIDGVLAGSSADGLNPDGTTFNPNFTVESATGEWIIGLGKALTGNYWKGNIDEIAVYDRVLDDPNGDADRSDSRVDEHRNAWWSETTGLLDFSASKTTVNSGDPVQLITKVGPDITSVTIDHGVGTVPLVNGTATITVNPAVTTTYQVTATGPGGNVTSSVSVTALQYQAPIVKGFAVTKLGTPGQVRLHWKVSQGEATNPTTLSIKAGATELHVPTALQGFADVDAGSANAFTLTAVNATGTTNANTALDAENNFSAAVRADAPVAWYRFNEPAGTELFVDSADNGAPHNGRATGTPVSGVAGVVDGAISLDANGGVVTDLILNPGQLDPGFTIETVVRRDAAINTLNRAIVSQADLNGTGRVLLSLSDANGTPRTYLGQGVRKDADANVAAETWAHLAVVVDALHTEVRWYLDGQLVGSTKDGTNPDGSTFDPNFIFEASEGAWNIGVQKTLTADLWRGEIDEVAIYNTLLDDPDADGDKADSHIAAHRAAWWSETSGIIQLSTAAASINPGQSTDLTIKVGPDITSASIDHGIGNVPLVNGNAIVPLNPTATTTYTITFSGPGGTFTQTVTVTVADPAPPAITSSSIQGGNFVLNFTGAPSKTYAVRGSATLATFNEDLGTVTTNASGAGTVTIPITPGATAARFFRIEELP
ncbi:LamG domain-containing protein [Luteolibacter soli]|uniref:LamG domain-containing protein n=1 Tax=Luteolibacter soli TaxID=3135280 RepID=A0ABU9AR76_9BACT